MSTLVAFGLAAALALFTGLTEITELDGNNGYEGQPGNQAGGGQAGYEGQPGNQGGGGNHGGGLRGYEGQPGNQGG